MELKTLRNIDEVSTSFYPKYFRETDTIILWRGVTYNDVIEDYTLYPASVGYVPSFEYSERENNIPSPMDVENYMTCGGECLTEPYSAIEYTSDRSEAWGYAQDGWLIITMMDTKYIKLCSGDKGWLVKNHAPGVKLAIYNIVDS